jgi:hypothetical protein
MTLRKRRARRREAGPAALDGLAQTGSDAEAQVVAEQLRHAVLELVGDLSETDRATLALAFTGESPLADERSRKRRFRALERLRAAWRRAHG